MRIFRVGLLWAALISLCLLAACAGPAKEAAPVPSEEPASVPTEAPMPGPAGAGEPLRLMVATDLHFISPRINDNGPRFLRAVESGDGKLSEYCEEIVDALLLTALEERPDALILTGDLTFNGERESLLHLAEKLGALQEAGVPVLVLPGNHDVGYVFAFSYEGEDAYWTANVSQPDFVDICGRFGYEEALSRDEASFSYMYELAEDCRLLFLDANTADHRGGLKDETLLWAEEQLKAAREAGVTVISASHQNVLAQSELLSNGYVLSNARKTTELLRKYGVSTHLSGHSHHQHSAVQDGLTDYCTGCLSLYPLRYAVMELDTERNIRYTPNQLDILQTESRARMVDSNWGKIAGELAMLDIPEETLTAMTDFAARLNSDYFAGAVDAEAAVADPAWALWEEYGKDSFWFPYMQSMLEE